MPIADAPTSPDTFQRKPAGTVVAPGESGVDKAAVTGRSAVPGWDLLSERERTIARLVSEALTNQQVARRVFLSPHTVNYHLRQIFRKLGINSRVQLAGLTFAQSQTDR